MSESSPPDEIEVRDLALAVAGEKIERLETEVARRNAHYQAIRAATIEECEAKIREVFASTTPEQYMMSGPGGILKRMIDGLRALKEQK